MSHSDRRRCSGRAEHTTSPVPSKGLPVKLPIRRFPIAVVTLKNRALTPVAQLSIERLRALKKPMRNPR